MLIIDKLPITKVVIETEQTADKNQVVMLQRNQEEDHCSGRSSNFLVVPALVMYCDDRHFRYVIAHEIGDLPGILDPKFGH